MVNENYSEGGSDSELSNDDFNDGEKKMLLSTLKKYSTNF